MLNVEKVIVKDGKSANKDSFGWKCNASATAGADAGYSTMFKSVQLRAAINLRLF